MTARLSQHSQVSQLCRRGTALALLLASLTLGQLAQAQFAMTPTPLQQSEPGLSAAADDLAYRKDGARHLYQTYPMQIWRGQLPPLLYAIAVIQTSIDAQGHITDLQVVREPAHAKEVTAWIVALIQRAQPFPLPQKLGEAIYTDIWLVDESGKFQLDTLTEGQRDE